MSLWTLTIADNDSLLDAATKALIDKDVRYVIEYLDRFLDWKGSLDVRVNVRSYEQLKTDLPGWDYDGIIPATEMGWVPDNGLLKKSNLVEMLTGEDINHDNPDAGFTIYLGKDGTIRNYGSPVWLDPNPQFQVRAALPAGSHDFVSIALHELMHTLAFDHGNVPYATLGSKVTEKDGVYYFGGEATLALLGQPLALDASGHVLSALTPFYKDSGLLRDYGNYEQNRWDIGRIELAVMKDLGFNVTSSGDGLSYTDLDDKRPNLTGTAGNDRLYGDFQNNVLTGGAGNDLLDGAAGIDAAVYTGKLANFTISRAAGVVTLRDNTGIEGTDTLISVERAQFADGWRALDIDGNGGITYRLYQAAIDRTPDLAGLGYWLSVLDSGAALADMAMGFVDSSEFKTKFGANLDAAQFVTQLYQNILHRPAEQAGFDYWVGVLTSNDSLVSRGQLLANFSESDENIERVAQVIGESIAYQPWGG